MTYFFLFLFALTLSFWLTKAVRILALRCKVVDVPDSDRKRHVRPTPLLGGVAIFMALAIILFWQRDLLVSGDLTFYHWLGVLVGAGFLIVGGILDDKYNLNFKQQIIWPILASLAVIAGGVGIEKITNPVSGLFFLNTWQVPLGVWFGQAYYFEILSDLFTFVWLMGMMYTTKLLDGVDGLVASVAGVGALVIFLFTVTTRYYQPDIAVAALVLAGACAGYLLLAWPPAKIFLGEGGSLLLGFVLGVLSIISGGKIAIALLIMGIPILDVVWTIVRRASQGKNPFKSADRGHLHFRLLDSGLSARKTVLIYCLVATVFGLSALFLQAKGKMAALIILVFVMLVFVAWFTYLDKKSKIS